MGVAVIFGLAVLAVVVFGKKAPGSDTVSDLGGDVDSSSTQAVRAIARGIAIAEGFFVAGSRPQRNHNPGDMTADLVGSAIGNDGDFVVYSNDQDGWDNLYAQVNAWLNGTSRHATRDSTISDVASFYTTTEQAAWAINVANAVGVSVDTRIGDING